MPTAQVIGKLSDKQVSQFTQLKQNATQLVATLGSLELKKARIIQEIDNNEAQAQELLKFIKIQFNIADGENFQIGDDGSIYAIKDNS